MANKSKFFLTKLKYLFIGLAVLVAEQLLTVLIARPDLLNLEYNIVLNIMFSLLIILFCILTLFLAKKMQLTDFKLKTSIPKFIGTVLLGVIGVFIATVIGASLIVITGKTNTVNQQALDEVFKSIPLLPYSLMIALLAPIVEEFVFRGLIIGKLFSKHKFLGCITSAVIFGLSHNPSNIGSWIIYAGTGAVLAFVYTKTDSLGTSTAIHMIDNGKSVLLAILKLLLK
ncbi:CAAX amino protease [Lactococcus hodotermopsidis]|uniref:CAAX amino protease n=1 Tax=Pseudolactococcus hodotermopsidis TaxID=2709157 RepID=A0A6A0BDX8_9LACT|nr:type II CAAX endopeptidase family protein [Lactococcus hodotermopsidis]GFH42548.1 CAAX amino protease [Lactococcus hodotermopsidis]